MSAGRDDLGSHLASLRIDRERGSSRAAPARAWRRWVPAAAACLVLGGVAIVAVRSRGATVTQAPPPVLPVPSSSQRSVELTATGYLVPQRTATVASKVSARVLRVGATAGVTMRAGETLFELDRSDDERSLAAARAHVAAASARRRVAAAQLAETKLLFEREAALASSGASPRAVAEDLRAKLAVLEAGVRAADADTLALGADAAVIDGGLYRYTITAPFDGLVLDVPAAEGEVVAPGTPLAELADLGSLLVEVDIPEARVGAVRSGASCEVVVDAFPDRRFDGVVAQVPPRISRAKATGTAKVRLLSPIPELRPDMAARVRVLATPPTQDRGDQTP